STCGVVGLQAGIAKNTNAVSKLREDHTRKGSIFETTGDFPMRLKHEEATSVLATLMPSNSANRRETAARDLQASRRVGHRRDRHDDS
ncbi:MAG: hypothetical protein Q9214_007859, partial [Letrouitia sp. 1 TL-2023]